MVKKSYRPAGGPTTGAAAYRDPVTVAEFGSKTEAEAVAALARHGGYDVTVRGLGPFAAFGSEQERGAYLVLAPKDEAVEVRQYLTDNGAEIIDDSPANRLNWRGAAIATAVLVAFLAIAVLAIAVKGG